ETKNGYQALPHVEPLVSLETFLAVQSRIDKYIAYYEEKLQDIDNLVTITPHCGECNGFMKHRRANPLDKGYFVCRDRHKRVAISVEETNDLVTQTVLDHVQSISIDKAEKIICKRITTENKRLKREQKKIVSEYLDTSLVVSTLDKKDKIFIPKYLDEIKDLK